MTRKRLSRTDWLDLGLAALAEGGIDAIKLEPICDAAGLTRGSFYHHFSDHGAFLQGLAERWAERQTEDLAKKVAETPPEDQAETLTEAALRIDYRLELGIRELGRRVPEVSEIVRKTDARRLSLLTDIYSARFGLAAAAARDFAFLEYAAFSGVILIDPDMDSTEQRRLAGLYDDMVAKVLGQ